MYSIPLNFKSYDNNSQFNPKNKYYQQVTHPLKDQFLEGDYEQSDTYPLDTNSGSSNVRITDVYLGENDSIYADGVEQEFNDEETGLQLIDHQYEFALTFLAEVLDFTL